MIPKIKKILDLSQSVYHACPAWPTYDCVVVDYEARHATHGFQAERINMNAHTGTHIDAPFHFYETGKFVEQMDLTKMQGRGIVVDLRGIGQMSIEVEHLEACGGALQAGDIALLYTGWGQKRAMTKEYLYEWPYLTGPAGQWLVDRGVKCVCTDAMSVGGWPEGCGAPPHESLLGGEVAIVEEVYMDDQLLEYPDWYVITLPLKLEGFGGAPARVIAMQMEVE